MKVNIFTAKDCPHRAEILNACITTFDFCAVIQRPNHVSELAMQALLADGRNLVNIKCYKVTTQGYATIADNAYFGGIFFSAAMQESLIAALKKHGFAVETLCQAATTPVLKI